ncbi:MAG TPA: tripartite tricarboxylate transporter substrate binding protein [Burkholderiaceae bacterium]|nr:tripartite tricarboxylate transporter substrate binding protein [Burkholderiaceae bacterium]
METKRKRARARAQAHGVLRWMAGALLATAAWAAQAQAWPVKPIKLVVSFAPGGAADLIARSIEPGLSAALKQPVIIENKPGANGNLGAEMVAKAEPDGYTLLMSSGGTMSANPFLYARMPFDPARDFTPVASTAVVRSYLVVHPSVPANTVQEFLAWARSQGGKLSYASAGIGSSLHLAGEMFKRAGKFEAVHVPYRGAAPALGDLMAGQVQFMFDSGPGLKQVAAGKLKALAVGSPTRSPSAPQLPTLAEAGMPGFDADTLFGIYAPAGVPREIVERLNAEINRQLREPKVQEVLLAAGLEPLPMGMMAFAERMRQERERLGAFIREAGLRAE